MCLFLTALLRDGRIDVEEYGIEIREFCVNFLWVVEAADVPNLSLLLFLICSYIDKFWVENVNYSGQHDIGRCRKEN